MYRSHLFLSIAICLFLAVHFFTPSTGSQSTTHSLSLDGTNDYLSAPSSTSLNVSGSITIEAWIKPNTTSSVPQAIISREAFQQADTGGGYRLAINQNGKLRLDLFQSHNQYTTAVGATTVTANTWHHVAGVFDGSQMRVYLDGVLDGSVSTTSGPASGSGAFYIGRFSYIYDPIYFGGLIDEVRVSAAALYTSNFTAGLGPGSNVRGYWKFDGQTPNDSSGNSNNGTLQNGATYSTTVPPIANSAPAVSITDPLNNTNFATGSNIVIDATAADSDGTVTQVEFYQGTTLLGTDNSSPYQFIWSPSAGMYSLTAKAIDNDSASTTSTAVNVTVGTSGTGNSLSLDGTNDYLSAPSSTSLNVSGSITIEAWVKANSTSGVPQAIISREAFQQAGTGGGYRLAINQNGKLRLDLFQSHNQYTTAVGATTVSANTWHHVAGVFDGSQMRVYLDGVLDGSVSTTSGPASGTGSLYIGRFSYIYDPIYFGGLIDEVRVSAAALYTSNFTAGLGPGSNVRGYWKFDGQTPNDSSGNGNNGTLQNGTTYSTTVPIQGPQRPVPNAGGPYSGQLGQSVQFSSSGSFDPDGTLVSYRWNFGDGSVATTANPTHSYSTSGTFTATLTLTDNAGLLSSATALVTIAGSPLARLDPRNETGGGGDNPLSQNYNWTLPLLNLPGRAGMDLNLSLSYNSLVWTKNGTNISFDDDRGFPSPGFHLGFPAIQQMHLNSETGKWGYLLIGSDGSRTELRQVGSSVYFESADSAHTLLDTSLLGDPTNPRMLLRATDGTQLTYKSFNYGNSNNYGVWSGFECTEVKDRNGNYLTVNYNATGNISSIIDTLGRTINFVYQNGSLAKIDQQWSVNGSNATHTWATFDYTNVTIQTSFSGLSVSGPANGPLKMLSKVTLDDNSDTPANNSRVEFDYTPWGQVWKISNFAADNHLLSYQSYKLPNSPIFTSPPAQTDCPRFNERRAWGQYANGDTDGSATTAEEVVTTFADPWSETWTMPTGGSPVTGMVAQVGTKLDATTYVSYDKIHYIGTSGSEGWRRSLPALIKTYDQSNVLQRQAVTLWEQDDQTKSYLINPRVKESWIIDSANQKRTVIEYEQFSLPNNLSCKLPNKVLEYAADATTVERSTWTSYLMTDTYKNRHILGLVSERTLHVDWNGALMAKTTFSYDESGSIVGTESPAQHDNTNYSSSFVAGRANLSKVKRIEVYSGEFTQSTFAYNNSGAMVSAKDHLNRETVMSYVDSFSDKTNTSTYAYPTSVTDPGGAINTQIYDFDFGAVTSRQGTAPNQSTTYSPGAMQSFEYYPHGALKKVTNSVNSAYVRYEHSSDKLVVKTFATIEDGKGESLSFVYTDGFGRQLGTATTHQTDATEFKFSGQRFKYDAIGRLIEMSNPTETTAVGVPFGWDATGDDDANDWVFTKQTYDWKGRPLVTTNPSLTANIMDTTTRSIVYAGCGCAGGEVATITDEGTVVNGTTKTRQQKLYADIFGRTVKEEVYDFEGTASGGGRQLYSTTITKYNIRDQVTLSRKFAGAAPTDPSDLSCPSGTCQRTEMTYDGYGRVLTSHDPVQQPELNNGGSSDHTTFYYNGDDTVAYLSDARGVVKVFTYNSRRQTTGISYNLGNIPTAHLRVAPTASVTFLYDTAGNRTRMTDGTGNITYHYDALARLDSETRQFAGPLSSNSYTLTYQYNLGNQLKQMTDHTNTVTTYDHNKAGQLEKVSGNLIPQVNDYATGYRYRAWGGLKGVSYANSSSQSVQYNGRLRPTTAALNNVRTDNMSQLGNLSWSYSYYPDGSQQKMQDSNDDRFDRLFEYDFVGRVKEAYSGREARGLAASTPNADNPFRQSYTYNAFNEPTGKTGRFWRTEQSGTEPCVPRTSTDGCDAEGNVLSTPYGAQTYDAEDRQVHHANHRYQVEVSQGWFEPAIEISQTYDGLGQVGKREETRRREVLVNGGPETEVDTSVETTYYIYSTALGGAKVIELTGDGQKDVTYVYANGTRLGKNKSGVGFSWTHANPGSNSWVESYSEGVATRQEMDPDGAEVGTVDPMSQVLVPGDLSYEKWHDEQPLYIEGGDPFDFVSGYTMNGLPMTRGEVMRRLSAMGVTRMILFEATRDEIPINLPSDPLDELHALLAPRFSLWGTAMDMSDKQDRTRTVAVKSSTWSLAPDVTLIAQFLNELLNTDGCGQFTEELINRLSSKANPMISDYIPELFEKVVSQKGMIRGDLATKMKVSAATTGNIMRDGGKKPGNAVVYLGEGFAIDPKTPAEQNRILVSELDAGNMVHELIHQAGSKQLYSDRQISEVLHGWLGVPGLPKRRDYKNDREYQFANSAYFQGILASKCKFRQRERNF